MIAVDALAKPIFDLLASFGPGVLPVDGPTHALRSGSKSVEQVHTLGRDGINQVNHAWDGAGADAATAKAHRVQTSAVSIADRGTDMASVVDKAAAIIERGHADLTNIAQSFLNTAAAAGPTLTNPVGIAALIQSALDHLGRAVAVVNRVRDELSGHTTDMRELSPPPPTPPPAETPAATSPPPGATAPASAAAPTAPAAASAFQSRLVSGAVSTAGSAMDTLLGAPMSAAAGTPAPGLSAGGYPSSESGTVSGEGVRIVLPDGSEVTAPNEKAATAVKSALNVVGTPYVWGGVTPGQGLDCSGLTQYAYGEAGVDLPRMAHEQANGAARVAPGDLAPGDLAVWDGHVAMVIGNGQFVEAGDPVQISSIRTENSGMDFYGFYRPTS